MIILPNMIHNKFNNLNENYSYVDEAMNDIKNIHAELFNIDFDEYLNEGYLNESKVSDKLKSIVNKLKDSINKSADTFIKRNNDFLERYKKQKTENEILLDKFTISDSFEMNLVKYYIADEIPDLNTINTWQTDLSKKFIVNIDEVKNGNLLRKVEDKIKYVHEEADIIRGYILHQNRGVTKKDFKDECRKSFTVNHSYEKRLVRITPTVLDAYVYNLSLYGNYTEYVKNVKRSIMIEYENMIYATLFEDIDNIVRIVDSDEKISDLADSRTKSKLSEYGNLVSSLVNDLIDAHILAFNIKLDCIEADRKQGEEILKKAKQQVGM